MTPRTRSIIELVLWIAGLAGVIAFLHSLGKGSLALPPFTADAWSGWLASAELPTLVFAIARAAAMAASCYLLVSTLTVCVTHALQLKTLSRLVESFTLPAVRVLTQRAVVLSFIGALSTPTVASAATAPEDVPLLRHVPADEVSAPPLDFSAVATPQPVAEPRHISNTWTVKRGDNLWTIAETALAESLDREPSDDEIVDYWREVVNLNRQQLVDSRNPNLIRPGQIMILPPTTKK